jgi:hypothetical protein
MDNAYKKKLTRASVIIQEVADGLESKHPEDFDLYGQRLFDLADEVEAILNEIEENEPAPDDDDGGDDYKDD